MSNIKVYAAEKELGLEELIKAKSSIAFVMPAGSVDDVKWKTTFASDLPSLLTKASEEDMDVYKTFSILVSTVWNLNDDIFANEDVWAARSTPLYKPTNLDHDEKLIVGNIFNSWAVDDDFKLIPNDTKVEDLPPEFHLLVSSVIYRQWQDEDLKSRAEQLIAEIEAGDKYVSMECLFNNFDYGVIDPAGNNHVVARTASTAFLSQFLRSYGGSGSYQGHKIGRVLRNITFSGKGYVDRPANPGSIIFDKDQHFSFAAPSFHPTLQGESFAGFTKNGVYNDIDQDLNVSEEIKNMSVEVLNEQVSELKASMATLRAENKELLDKLSTANVSQFETKISELEAQVAAKNEEVEALQAEATEASNKIETLEVEVSDKTAALAEVSANFDKMEEEKKKKERKDKMSDAGLSIEEIEAKYESFVSMSDEQFEAVMETIASLKAPETTETTEASTEEAPEEEVETTEASEIVEEEVETGNHSVAGDEDEEETSSASAGLAQWASTIIKK